MGGWGAEEHRLGATDSLGDRNGGTGNAVNTVEQLHLGGQVGPGDEGGAGGGHFVKYMIIYLLCFTPETKAK